MTNKIHSNVITIGDKQEVHNQMAKWSYTQIENVDVDVKGFLISNRGKLFATNEAQLTDNAIDIFLAFVATCHVAQTLMFRSAPPMVVPTNLLIGTEHRRWGLEHHPKRNHKVYPVMTMRGVL